MIEAVTGEQGLEMAALHTPHAALLDVVLPGIDGVEVCRRLREWSDMAIIVLSAIDEEDTKVRALHAGADDYVTKPFATGELVARLRAALRRVESEPASPVLRADGLEVDLRGPHGAARRCGGPFDQDGVRAAAPADHQPRTRGDASPLMAALWGADYTGEVTVLRGQLANLRRKIEPASGARYIRTESGVGYRFLGAST